MGPAKDEGVMVAPLVRRKRIWEDEADSYIDRH